ncbi:MAG: N-acetyl-gamma-glutamyl-phosphate reductase [Gemmatimonadota bacterium]|nr:N-acetyl-gamma-glutamyl-phosphate reductase [Gemmatimonadota bacterium]
MNTHNNSVATVGIVGATGYTGLEVLRILRDHEGVRVAFATSEREAGEASALHGLTLVSEADADLRGVDIVFLCLPHGMSVEWAQRALDAGCRVVDLTADHRPGSGREGGAVYGLADFTPDTIRAARLVANPGCYPTGVITALHPLLVAGVVRAGTPVIVNAASGVTGAGRTAKRELLFAEVAGDYRAYAMGNVHRHLKEMRATLPGLPLLFQPHLLPVPRGILETIYLSPADGVTAQDILEHWKARFAGNPTVRVLESGVPALVDVVGSDIVALGVAANAELDPSVLTLVVALDNLGKGAAGQAVQNMNLMMGFDPTRGLRR